MDETPTALLRLTRFLGGEPSRAASLKQYWFSLIGGAALVALLTVLSLGVRGKESSTWPPA
jgi:hypothetical protein